MNPLPVYTTKDADTVDLIAWRYYKSTDNHIVEQLLAANQGLADLGPVLPAGVRVVLPDLAATTKAKGMKLWD